MPLFERSVEIAAPVAKVFAFHERPDALELLTPKFPPVRVISRTGGIGDGARVELRVLGLRWLALHRDYRPGLLFVDEQIEGPFHKWIHRHRFQPLGPNRTRLTDSVEFELPGGPLVNQLLAWAVRPGLIQMFTHRHKVTKALCE